VSPIAAAEQKLRDSENRFRGAFEHAPFGMCLCALDGRFLQANSALRRMLGYSTDELLKLGWPNVTHPDDLETSRRTVDQVMACLTTFVEHDKRYIKRSGEIVLARTRISLVLDSHGAPSHYVAYIEDISERRRTAETVRETEERFRIMADGCPTAMWVTGAEGGIQFINRMYQQLLGAQYSEVEGHKWQVALHTEDRDAYLAAFTRAVREHTSFHAETRARGADGEWRWFSSYAEPRFSPAGEFLGHVGLSPDITEQKQEQQQRQFQLTLIRAILDVSPDGILVVNDEGLIVAHNQKFLETWRIPMDRIPDNFPDFFGGDQRPVVLSAVLERVKDPDGFLKRIVELNANPQESDRCENRVERRPHDRTLLHQSAERPGTTARTRLVLSRHHRSQAGPRRDPAERREISATRGK
jgi:PAS domain S-box-containing protein